MLEKEQMEKLRQPFPPELIQWKPGATTKDKTKALGLAYVDSRHYQARLDDVVGPGWSDDYEVHQSGSVILCRLTIDGVTRTDVGEKDSADKNTVTSAKAQSFKRACAAFGLGRYLYEFPQHWAPYNSQWKRFTDEALAQLANVARTHKPNQPAPSGNGNPSGGNGGGKQIPKKERAESMRLYANQKLGQERYKHINHLRNAIQLEAADPDWDWPDTEDGWKQGLALALAHAKKETA